MRRTARRSYAPAIIPLAALLATGCPGRAPALDGGLDAAAPDVPATAPDAPPDAPRTALPSVTLGDLTLQPYANGGFELTSGARTLLASPGGPVEAEAYTETVTSLFGLWTFRRGNVHTFRPQAGARATVDATSLLLALDDGYTQSTLRFTRVSPGEVELRAHATAPTPFQATVLHFACTADAHFLGFGEQYNNTDQRGRAFPLFVSEQGVGRDPAHPSLVSGDHSTTYFPVPFFLDPRGFGLAVDTDARTSVDLCAHDPGEYTLAPEQPEEVLLHLYTGPTAADVMRDWTALQGRSSAPPAWAVQGVWLGVEGGPEPVRAAVATAQSANIPLAAIWAQDWVGEEALGANLEIKYHWTADPTLYPDLAGMITELHGEGVRFLAYFNPFVVQGFEQWDAAVANHYLPRTSGGAPYAFGINEFTGSMVDLTNPAAVAWYRTFAADAIRTYGIDGWMADFGEWLPYDAVLSDGRDARRYHNHYPLDWHAAERAELEAQRPDGDWVMFSRSGWLREAQVAQVVWAGDQEVSFGPDDGLPTVIPAMVSLGLAGIGFPTHDVAGFYGGPSDSELFHRWVELAAFTPVFRTHPGLMQAQNWRFDRDAETLAHFARFARVHAALAPRIMALATEHQATGMPIVRALGLAYPDDRDGYAVTDEYMLGDDLLVAPVVTQGATTRSVHLPPGDWYDVWAPATVLHGPGTVMVSAPIGRPPVFSTTMRTDLAAIE